MWSTADLIDETDRTARVLSRNSVSKESASAGCTSSFDRVASGRASRVAGSRYKVIPAETRDSARPGQSDDRCESCIKSVSRALHAAG